MLSKEDYDIVLATSTGALPAWMARKYPEVERVDYEGRRHKFGQRHNACPNSEIFRKYSVALAAKRALCLQSPCEMLACEQRVRRNLLL